MFFFFDENENKKEVPGFEQTIKPILTALVEVGGQASVAELDKKTIEIMDLSEEVLQIKHKDSKKLSEISYRMAWGRTYLKKYGLLKNENRGIWSLTDKFDGDIENINVDEIVRKVRNESTLNGEYKKALSGFESELAFENMVGALLKELARKEGKRFYYGNTAKFFSKYDFILPDGLENNKEELNGIIQYVKTQKYANARFWTEVIDLFECDSSYGKYLFVTNIIVTEEIRKKLGENVIVWDKDDLLERFEPEAEYAQYLINPRQALIEDLVTSDNSSEQRFKERENYIKQIKEAYQKEDMVLFIGAGVSSDSGIPRWGTLIKKLHIYMLNRLTKDKALSFEQQKMIKELAFNNEMESPLMQMRYIKAAFQSDEYLRLVHSALYDQDVNINTELLNAIARICTPQRAYCGVKSIITYNFDNLLEMKFSQKDIRYNIIKHEEDRQLVEKLNVYHVHGYLPNEYSDVDEEPELIFSEEDYHRVYRDSYSWSNLAQLNALRENTCLFIGCSLTDPNLRRLLDVAARNGESPRHYAFMKKNRIQNENDEISRDILDIYQKIDDNIQTAYYKELGLNIIWIDEFEEIPNILSSLLE